MSVIIVNNKTKQTNQLFSNLDEPYIPLWAKLTICGVLGVLLAIITYYLASQHYFSAQTVSIGAVIMPAVVTLLVGLIIIMSDRVRRRHQETLRMRGELMSIASRELRAPLNGIRWGEELLMSAQLPEKEAKIVETIYQSTLQLQESIDDMMQLASLQTSATIPRSTRVTTNIVEMIDTICTAQQLSAQKKGIEFEYGPNWPVLVMTSVDPLPMRRTFDNIISNAVKYSQPNTKVTIDYEVVEGNHVFTVHDRGIGIPKDEQHKVFGGSYRASNAVKLSAIGTGMGLYLSRNVVEQHHGKLWLSSKEGEGTTVYIQLPK